MFNFIEMKINNIKLPVVCPSCDNQLYASTLTCSRCDTAIQGKFPLPALLLLSKEEQAFIFDFVMTSGSLKLMAEKLKLSYPTVRNMLDAIIAKLNTWSDEANKIQ